MKYIRTEDKTIYGKGGFILEIEKLNLNKIVGNIKYEIIDNKLIKTMYGYEAHIFEYDIINQADTIEELCDYFYIDTGNLEDKSWYTHSQYIEFLRDVCVFETENIEIEAYGIIKTSKGLIYVAKMDSEGKLVLI